MPPLTMAATPMALARDMASMSIRAPTTSTAPEAEISMREAGSSASGASTARTMRPTEGRPQPTWASTARPSTRMSMRPGKTASTSPAAGVWMTMSPLPAARRVTPSRPCSQTRVRYVPSCDRRPSRLDAGAGTWSRMSPGRSPMRAAVVGISTASCSRNRSMMGWPISTRWPGITSGRSDRCSGKRSRRPAAGVAAKPTKRIGSWAIEAGWPLIGRYPPRRAPPRPPAWPGAAPGCSAVRAGWAGCRRGGHQARR